MDWRRTARRLAATALAFGALAVLGVGLTAWFVGGVDRTVLVVWLGLTGLAFLSAAVGVVAVSALRGMLRAGDQGERLAERDVGLLPPQARRWRRPVRQRPARRCHPARRRQHPRR